ncbi:MAG TPA: 4-(cytidine 5'-diphospho)-2-C-methyl-D-erythritol kinase [Syntrophales bacterium]|nr:4-(cytidine 5'-diphospho)-2-C-methyl-D-erythritol kinase [Syntrophales bacterium]
MVKKLSPAKVNLHLTVLGKRGDGYHDIVTLMQKISLCDEMTFSLGTGGGRLTLKCPGSDLPDDERNIVYRAAKAYLTLASCEKGVAISIKKKIPVAAGLGGGSSNAATTLIALNEMLGNGLSRGELIKIGKELGADVPFFIFGQTAWAFGAGDILQAAENIPPLWFLLVNPRFAVSTKAIYESLNLGLTKDTINYSIPRFQIKAGNSLIEGLKNDLEGVTLNLHPQLNQLKKDLLRCGARGALMSGSGPTVFGIFEREDRALKAKEALTNEGSGKLWVYLAHSI